jgi:hypothetical protein
MEGIGVGPSHKELIIRKRAVNPVLPGLVVSRFPIFLETSQWHGMLAICVWNASGENTFSNNPAAH